MEKCIWRGLEEPYKSFYIFTTSCQKEDIKVYLGDALYSLIVEGTVSKCPFCNKTLEVKYRRGNFSTLTKQYR